MARDGSVRGGARIGAGRKLSSKTANLPVFEDDFDPKNAVFEPKTSQKRSKKSEKCSDSGVKSAENASKTSENTPKTFKTGAEKVKNPSKTSEKAVAGSKSVKKSASNVKMSGQAVKKTAKSSRTSTEKSGNTSKSPGKSASKTKAAPKAATLKTADKGKRSVKKNTDTVHDTPAAANAEPCIDVDRDKGCGAEEIDDMDIGSDSEDIDDMEDDYTEDVSDSADCGRTGTPHVDEYMRAQQKCGKELKADIIYKRTIKWLRSIKCSKVVSNQLVKQYAMSVARWIQTEELISETGFLASHPTTGQSIASPYVAMSQNYMKQVNQLWYQIYQIVKENCSDSVLANSDDPMERLLRERGG